MHLVWAVVLFFFFKQKTAYEIGLGIPAEPLFRSMSKGKKRSRLPLVPRNGCGRPGRAPERFLPLDITSLLLHVIFRSEERRVGKECRSGWLPYDEKENIYRRGNVARGVRVMWLVL